MLNQKAKRFWKDVTVVDLSAAGDEVGTKTGAGAGSAAASGRFGVCLDGRPVRVPSKAPLALCSKALAEGVAEEWRSQEEVIDPFSMPLTQLANTAQDRMGPLRDTILAELLEHVEADTLCYYAAEPPDLLDRQHAAWTPVLAWAAETYQARWATTTGIMPVTQPATVHAAISDALVALNDEELAVYQVVAPATSSAVIGLAVVAGRLTAEQAFAAAAVDELFQAEQWGEDWEAQDRRDRLMADLTAAERFLTLCRMP